MRLSTKMAVDRWLAGGVLFLLKPVVMLLGRVLHRDHALRVGRRLLVVKLAGGGSLFIALPNLLGLRRRHPGVELILLTTPAVRPFAVALGVFDRIEILDDRSLPGLLRSAVGCWWRLLGVDTVVDLEVHSNITTLLALGTLARNRLAFYLHDSWFKRHIATHLLFLQQGSGIFWFYDQIFGLLGAAPVDMAAVGAHLVPPPVPPRPDVPRPHVGLGHACSELGKERELPPQGWVTVLGRRFARGDAFTVEIMGGAGDAAGAELLAAALRAHFPRALVMVSCGRYTVPQVLPVLAGMDEFWGIDSALLHVARALGRPTRSFWGPTDPATRLRAVEPSRDVVVYAKLPCSPCVHVAACPPCRGDSACMRDLWQQGAAAE